MEAIILAGGFGLRMGSFSKDTQKCLLPIDGKPTIGHILDRLVEAFGSVDVKVGVGYKGEQVKNWVDKNKPNKVKVSYVVHKPGCEYSAYMTMDGHIHGPFIGAAGDIIVSASLYEEAAQIYERAKVDIIIAFSPYVNEVKTHAVGKIDREGRITTYQWPPSEALESDCLRDMNIYASCGQSFFEILREYPALGQGQELAFKHALTDGRPLFGFSHKMRWIHLANAVDLQKSAREIGI